MTPAELIKQTRRELLAANLPTDDTAVMHALAIQVLQIARGTSSGYLHAKPAPGSKRDIVLKGETAIDEQPKPKDGAP